jgi:solute carrier family 25 (mitochondrial dicarboxylate transporter), member 10
MQIVLVRMCADGAKAPAQRFDYGNAIQGIIRVAREEGARAFFKGLGPNVVRSVLMSEYFTLHLYRPFPTLLPESEH